MLSTKLGSEFLIFSNGNFSPIVPVHAKSILSGRIIFGYSSSCFCFKVSFSDKSDESTFKASYPCCPVSAFAFLALINIA